MHSITWQPGLQFVCTVAHKHNAPLISTFVHYRVVFVSLRCIFLSSECFSFSAVHFHSPPSTLSSLPCIFLLFRVFCASLACIFVLWRVDLVYTLPSSAQKRRNVFSREEKQLGRAAMYTWEEHCTCGPPYVCSAILWCKLTSEHTNTGAMRSAGGNHTFLKYDTALIKRQSQSDIVPI